MRPARVPEIRRQLLDAGVEQVGVLDGLVAVVVLGVHADDRRLDAQVDVLRHQRHARLRVLALQRERVREDRVVGAVAGQRVRQAGRRAAGSGRTAGRVGGFLPPFSALGRRQLEAAVDLLLGRVRHQLVEEAAHLAHVARGLGHALLAGVEFLEHGHRDEDVVFLEPEDRASGRASARWCRARRCGAGRSCFLAATAGSGERRRVRRGSERRGRRRGLRRRARRPSPCATPGAARPCASIRKVLRSTPMYFLPYMLFSFHTSKSAQAFLSSSASSSNGNSNLALNFSCEASAVGRNADDRRCRALRNCGVQVAEVARLPACSPRCCPSG